MSDYTLVMSYNVNVWVFLYFQAFLEMGTEEAAMTMVNYYNTVSPHIRHATVFVQYSNHKELKTDAGNQVSRTSFLVNEFCYKT